MSYIYFVQAKDSGPVKIGSTSYDPRKRLQKIQSDCPWPIRLLGVIIGYRSQEKEIHSVLAPWRTQGEWYKPHPIILAAVAEALKCGRSLDVSKQALHWSKPNHFLKIYRRKSGLTLKELANRVGASPSALSKVEKGVRPPTFKLAVKLRDETGFPIEDFLVRPSSPPANGWGVSMLPTT